MTLNQLSKVNHGWALFWVDFILPLPLTFLILYLWYIRTHNWPFSLYVIILPLLFGYIIPGIGTNILKMWAFKWDFMRMGNYFIHHGFMYAPYFAFSLYLTFGNVGQLSFVQSATIIISNSFLQCFLTTWHDYWAVKSGMIEIYNRPFREGKSAAEIILDYGPIGYALFGFTYAASCLMAFHFFITSKSNSLLLFILIIVFGLFIMGLSGIHYIIRERMNYKINE
jgi:hypothetical protein